MLRMSDFSHIFESDMQTRKGNPLFRLDNVFIHILVWCIVFGLPIYFIDRETGFNWMKLVNFLPVPVFFMTIFYTNYLWIVDHFLFREKSREFIIINVVLILILAACMHFWHEISGPPSHGGNDGHAPGVFILRDVLSLILVAALSIALKLSVRWVQVESERKELEKAKTEAELQNLKNQLNPHFLLNTLNNIYALIGFNPEQAQQSIIDLSKMLRYMLYDNNQAFVPLSQEADFIRNYIALMRIRLAENVKLKTTIQLQPNGNTLIAPLIFISLIENAFKHGISGSEPSFIDISLKEKPDHTVECCINNSYFPKTDSDKSGSGIGLQQIKKRLELHYSGQYIWETQVDGNTYTTQLIINTQMKTKDDA